MSLIWFREPYHEDLDNPFYFAHKLLFCFTWTSAQLRVEVFWWLYHSPLPFPRHRNQDLWVLTHTCTRLYILVGAWLKVPTPSVAASEDSDVIVEIIFPQP